MDIINLLDLHTREEFRRWLAENHDREDVCWLRSNRAEKPVPGIISYIDAVEVALCYGWIDSTQRRIDDGKPIQRFTPRRKGSVWCERNIERCRRLIKLGEMTPAGYAVLPDMDPAHFVIRPWVLDALRADAEAWQHFQTFPPAYCRIRIFMIQHYADTGRQEQARQALERFVADTHAGKMLRGWSDYGRLENY